MPMSSPQMMRTLGFLAAIFGGFVFVICFERRGKSLCAFGEEVEVEVLRF